MCFVPIVEQEDNNYYNYYSFYYKQDPSDP